MKTVGKTKYYSLEEATRFLDEPVENVRSWIGKGGLPTRVIDGETMIPAIPLNDFYYDRLPIIKRQRREAGQIKKASEKPARKEQQAKQAESTTRFSGGTNPRAGTPEEYAYYYTPAQVAEMLATDILEVNQMVRRGDLSAISVAKHRWFPAKNVEDLVRHKHGPGRLVSAPEPQLIHKPQKQGTKEVERKDGGTVRKRTGSEPEPITETAIGSRTHYKVCTKCGFEKQINEFNQHPTNRDGLQSNCRECNRIRARERYQQNRGNARDRQRQHVSG